LPSHSKAPAQTAPEPAFRPSDAGTVIAGSNVVAAVAAAPALVDFGSRYRVEAMLGEGGMGAVYKAYDLELDRMVALKLVRPELTRDPGVYQRFKQELLLASKISHKNILRTHDLGEAPGVKFISMAYVDGRDLRQLIVSEGKLPAERAVNIARQLCAALDAAHSEGVVHRDLKPQNVLVDRDDTIYISDFGLAKSLESDLGMTNTGQFLGTPRYMSPEQAEAKAVDHRSDLYAFGLILCEMLTADIPFEPTTSAMQMMFQRVQNPPKNPQTLDPTMPAYLAQIIRKCLERDPERRYQSAREILADLDAARAPTRSMQITLPSKKTSFIAIPLVVALALVIVLAVRYRSRLFPGSSSNQAVVSGPVMSLAILPFRNASGDASLDWLGPTLADMLSTGVGQSAQMRIISPDRLQQVLSDLRIRPETTIDSTMVGHIANSSGANTIFWGKYIRLGEKVRIDGVLQDLKHDQRTPITVDAPSDKDISGTASQIADQIRQHLSVSRDILKDLKANAFQPSSKSAVALRDYTQGVQLLREGRNLDAVKVLEAAVKEDPDFALAYSRLAEANSALGYDIQAEQSSRKALELSQQLPLAEKYLIEANHAYVMKDNKKAIEAFENLSKTFPDDPEVGYELGSLYADNGDFDKAKAQFAKILKADPKNIRTLWQMGSVEYQRGDPQAALEPLDKGLSLAVELDNPEQKAFILQALGISYRLMNKPEEAIKSLQDSMEVTRKLGMKRLLAACLGEMADNQITIGKPDAAMASYNQALQILREVGVKKDYGDLLINRGLLYTHLGEYDKALQDYKDALQIQRDANDVNYQALCLNNIGVVYFKKYDLDNALIYYQQSLQLRQQLNQPVYLAQTLSSLADVHAAMGNYDQALASLMKAVDISRSANDAEDAADVSESIGKVLMYEGRLGGAVNAMQDSVNSFRSIKNRSYELARSLNGLADTLAMVGRGEDSGKPLEEANALAKELKNENLNGELLNTRGDAAFYRGEYNSARGAYEQAALIASRKKERQSLLIAKMNLARVAIAEGRAQAAIPELRAAIQEADTLHLKYYWLRGSVDLAEAMIKNKDYAHARPQLNQAMNISEKLGTRLVTAIIHFQLGNLLKQTGDAPGAAGQYRQAVTLLDEIKKEQGAEHILDRADLKVMYIEATQGAQLVKT